MNLRKPGVKGGMQPIKCPPVLLDGTIQNLPTGYFTSIKSTSKKSGV